MTKTLESQNQQPERMCLICHRRFPKKDLIRLVNKPDGKATIDSSGQAEGRGYYICHNPQCWTRLLEDKKIRLRLDKPDRDRLESLLGRVPAPDPPQKALAFLGLARRAGKLSLGLSQAAASLTKGEAVLLLRAQDISDNSLDRFQKLVTKFPVKTAILTDKTTLGKALGTSPLAVLSVNDPDFSDNIINILNIDTKGAADRARHTEVENR